MCELVGKPAAGLAGYEWGGNEPASRTIPRLFKFEEKLKGKLGET